MLSRLSLLFISTEKTILSVVKLLVMTRFVNRFKYDKPLDKSCVILANGPSLNELINKHKTFLNSKELFGVNHFVSTPYFEELKPTHYVLQAPEFFTFDVHESYLESNKLLFQSLKEKTDWSMNLYVPFLARKTQHWKKILAQNKNIILRYYNTTPIEGFSGFQNFCFKLGFGMPRPHNVLIPSLMIALNSGFKEIMLWGADHSWLPEITVDSQNKVMIAQKHFYDEKEAKPAVMRKLGKGERRLHEVLQKFVYSFAGYFDLRDYAESIHVKIINQTPGSYIDAFERQNLGNNSDIPV